MSQARLSAAVLAVGMAVGYCLLHGVPQPIARAFSRNGTRRTGKRAVAAAKGTEFTCLP